MKTSIITVTETITRVSNIIAAKLPDGREVYLPYSQRWKLHPGYVKPTYLNSYNALIGIINAKQAEFIKPNPYHSYGVSDTTPHYKFKGECYIPYKEWLIKLLKEIRANGGLLKYNHPKRVASVLNHALYECHSAFGYHSGYSPMSLKEYYKLREEYGLLEEYPEVIYPELNK